MLNIVGRFKNSIAHEYKDGVLVCSSKNKVFLIDDLENPKPIVVGEIPWRNIKYLSHIRILDRVLQNSIKIVHRTNDHQYIIASKNTWWKIDRQGMLKAIPDIKNVNAMNRGVCETSNGVLYIGEYGLNCDRDRSIRIYRSRDLDTFEVAWEFPEKSIRHIHALIPDVEVKNRIWVLTGDLDHESHFFYTDDDFKTLNIWLSEGQVTRSIDIAQKNGDIYWGMDSPDEKAFIIKSNFETPNNYERVYELPGPVYYIMQNKAGSIYMGTTVEPGEEVKDNIARIISLRGDGNWKPIVSSKSDIYPQYGIFYLPTGMLPEDFVVYSQRALIPHEGYMTIARDNMND